MATIRWGLGTGADVCLPFVGNSTLASARYIGAGGADDDVALDWNVHGVDANTVAVWRMDEAAWAGVAGEVLDASGNGHHGQAVNGATTAAGWMNRAGSFVEASQHAVRVPHHADLNLVGDMTLELWWYMPVLAPYDWYFACAKRPASGGFPFSLAARKGGPGTARTQFEWHDGTTFRICSTRSIVPEAAWFHIAAVRNQTTKVNRIYVNGQQFAEATLNYTPGASTTPVEIGAIPTVGAYYQTGLLDDLRISNVARYSANFAPTRYPASGSVVAVTPLTLPRTINAIAWAATVGAEIGAIYQVHVNTGTDAAPVWTQVGGDNPTSPITPIGLVTTAADLVRVTLTPRDDALKSETPTLDWLEVDWAAVTPGVVTPGPPPAPTADLSWRMIAATAGPDRFVGAARLGGRTFVGAEVRPTSEMEGALVWHPEGVWIPSGRQLFIIGSGGLPEIMSEARSIVATQWGYALGPMVQGDNGYFPDGMYWGAQPVWMQPEPPAHGRALMEIAEGELVDATPEGISSARAICVAGGYLWLAGAGRLLRYDGETWEDALPGRQLDIRAMAAVGDELLMITTEGAYRWRNFGATRVGPVGGVKAVGHEGRGYWLAAGQQMILGEGFPTTALEHVAGKEGLAGYAGKVWTVTQGGGRWELGWLDGGRARGVLWGERIEHEISGRASSMDTLGVLNNRLYAFGDDGWLGPQARMVDAGGRTARIDGGRWRLERIESEAGLAIGRLPCDPGFDVPGGGRRALSIGQVILDAPQGVRLDWLEHEHATGEGETPALESMEHRWSTGPKPSPGLTYLGHEWADGEGDTPELASVEHHWADGSGAGAALESLMHEWRDTDPSGGAGDVRIDWLRTEWARGEVGPQEGEEIVFAVRELAADVIALRLVLDGAEVLSDDWRAMIRIDREEFAVDDWGSYEGMEIGGAFVPTRGGREVRIGIVGPWGAGRAPRFGVQAVTVDG